MTETTDQIIGFIADRCGDVLFRCWEMHPGHERLAISIAERTVDQLVTELAEDRGWTPEETSFAKQAIIERADARASYLVDLASIAHEPGGKLN